ncbi:MAG: ribonuclease H-like domain-containing protein [Candidatus Magasanikbacteria bacterium]|nr:ribonuclease H-like domain-containing protein [Candidatus Magasanikbacteria bacterium]
MKNEVVFDIETQNTFAEVENDMKKFKISVVSVYRYETDTFESFTESELGKLWPILEKADRIIGYNSEHFDIPILMNYYMGDLTKIPHLDIMKIVKGSLGIRLKLADLAAATLDDIKKSADGLQAVRWWREGKIDEIKKYCEQDVNVTKQLYEFGRDNRQLFYKSLSGDVVPFAVDFSISNDLPENTKINLTLPL